MPKISDKNYRLFSLFGGILFLGVAVYFWIQRQEPIQPNYYYFRAIGGNTVISIIFFAAAIRGQKGLNNKKE